MQYKWFLMAVIILLAVCIRIGVQPETQPEPGPSYQSSVPMETSDLNFPGIGDKSLMLVTQDEPNKGHYYEIVDGGQLDDKASACRAVISENSVPILEFLKDHISIDSVIRWNLETLEEETRQKCRVDCLSFERAYHIITTDNTVVVFSYESRYNRTGFSDYHFHEKVACEMTPDGTVLKLYPFAGVFCSSCHV